MQDMYLVMYDICDPQRLKRVYKKMCGFGEHLQYSVFQCRLTEANLVRMKTILLGIIAQSEDQVLIFRLGPVDSKYTVQVSALGQPYNASTPSDALIV